MHCMKISYSLEQGCKSLLWHCYYSLTSQPELKTLAYAKKDPVQEQIFFYLTHELSQQLIDKKYKYTVCDQ